jgi:uncharacterized protein YjbJ (UPF0337 family)
MALFPTYTIGDNPMNKDRIKGSAEQAKGKVKEVAGKATGDKKLETEGKAHKGQRKDSQRRRGLEGRCAREMNPR